ACEQSEHQVTPRKNVLKAVSFAVWQKIVARDQLFVENLGDFMSVFCDVFTSFPERPFSRTDAPDDCLNFVNT
ncbi:hypothetical protein, partial [Escherichia coli]|uniref:hypothetical protein n=1 Tax=Escherichia coli TaxID=562 RepID=UPI002878C4F5